MRNIRDKQARLNNIISILLDRFGDVQYKELKKETGLSDPVLSKYLKYLVDSKIISSKTSGREKYYTISKEEFEKTDYKILEVIQNYWMLFSTYSSIQNTTKKEINDTIDKIEKNISGMIFYLIIKSLDDGKNWMHSINFNDFGLYIVISFLNYFTRDREHDKLNEILESPKSDTVFEEFKKIKFTQDEIKLWGKLKSEVLQRYEKQIRLFEDTKITKQIIDDLIADRIISHNENQS